MRYSQRNPEEEDEDEENCEKGERERGRRPRGAGVSSSFGSIQVISVIHVCTLVSP